MQMIERPWGITVYSTASVKAPPDLVRLRFHVARLQQTPAEAFAAATEAVGAVRRAIRAHNVPDADVQRSRLSLKSQWNFGNERKFLGYQCQASFSVESRDLDDVQLLLVDVVQVRGQYRSHSSARGRGVGGGPGARARGRLGRCDARLRDRPRLATGPWRGREVPDRGAPLGRAEYARTGQTLT